MDAELDCLTEQIASNLSSKSHDVRTLVDLRDKVMSKTDIFRTLGDAVAHENAETPLLAYIHRFQYPAQSFAGILFLWHQANCLRDNFNHEEDFFQETRRLLLAVKHDQAKVVPTKIAKSPGKILPSSSMHPSLSSSFSQNISTPRVEDWNEEVEVMAKEAKVSKDKDDDDVKVTPSNIYQFLSKELAVVLDKAVKLACDQPKRAMLAVEPLRLVAEALRPRNGCLTSADSCFLRACISGQCYSYAERQLDKMTILEIDPQVSYLDTASYLSFFYYAGIVYIARNRLAKAIENLEYAITVPSEICSAISLEAYKKAMLVSLLLHGTSYVCPKFTSSVVRKRCNNFKEYSQIADLYEACKNDKMKILLQKKSIKASLIADGNWGLVKQLYSTLQTKAMRNLTSTYIKLSLEDIAHKIEAPSQSQVETDLVKLIAEGTIEGSIDQATGVVSFGVLSSKTVTGPDTSEVISAIRESIDLADKLRVIKANVLSSKSYVKSISLGSGASGRVGMHSFGKSRPSDLGDFSTIDDEMDME